MPIPREQLKCEEREGGFIAHMELIRPVPFVMQGVQCVCEHARARHCQCGAQCADCGCEGFKQVNPEEGSA